MKNFKYPVNSTVISSLNCQNHNKSALSLQDCEIKLNQSVCNAFIKINCAPYDLAWKGIHLYQYAKDAIIDNAIISDFALNDTNSLNTAILIDYFDDYQLTNLVLKSGNEAINNSVGILIRNLNPLKANNKVFNITSFDTLYLFKLLHQSFSRLSASDLTGSSFQIGHFIEQSDFIYSTNVLSYQDLCSSNIYFNSSDEPLTIIFDSTPLTDCRFNVSAEISKKILIQEMERKVNILSGYDYCSLENVFSIEYNEHNSKKISKLKYSNKLFIHTTVDQSISFSITKKSGCINYLALRIQFVDGVENLSDSGLIEIKNSIFENNNGLFLIKSETNVDYKFINLTLTSMHGFKFYGEMLSLMMHNSSLNSYTNGLRMIGNMKNIDVFNSKFEQLGPMSEISYVGIYTNFLYFSSEFITYISDEFFESDRFLQKSISIVGCEFSILQYTAIQIEFHVKAFFQLSILSTRPNILNHFQNYVANTIPIDISKNRFHNAAVGILLNDDMKSLRFYVYDIKLPRKKNILNIESNEFIDCMSALRDELLYFESNQWSFVNNLLEDTLNYTQVDINNRELVKIKGNGSFSSNSVQNINRLSPDDDVHSLIFIRVTDFNGFKIERNSFVSNNIKAKYLLEISAVEDLNAELG